MEVVILIIRIRYYYMLKDKFIDLVNSSKCEEFSDIPEGDVEFICGRVNEIWSIDETFSISTNIYRCEDGLAGVRGVCHIMPNCELKSLPNCEAFEVEEKQVSAYVQKGGFKSDDWRFKIYEK